jgi:Tol biopolymer transport system component
VKKLLFIILSLFHFIGLLAEAKKGWPVLKGPYLGQKPPGITPAVFAPGIISTEATEFANTFSPDGKEFYFTRVNQNRKMPVIMFTGMVNNLWQKPRIASFSGKYHDVDPMFSADNNSLYFSSSRPLNGQGARKKDYDNWHVMRTATGWSEPRNLGSMVNSTRDEFYPSFTKNGTLYFISFQNGGYGKGDFYRSELSNGKFSQPENLGSNINTQYREGDGFIAPDESYFLFSAFIPGNTGSGDLYISFRKKNGLWTRARNLGEKLNSKGNEFTPVITPDGKYLFFASDRSGNDEIYWVDATVIDDIKPKELK